ncbi:hypothetical protein HY411_02080 [Candidatus Gottesmanbacteria bacterium]|nr:hypothetical protein [Candidatus Gottesmanbacteria bacterium]
MEQFVLQPRPHHTFIIASLSLVGLVCFVFLNIWLYKQGQMSAGTTVLLQHTPSNVLGETQTRVSPTGDVTTPVNSFDNLTAVKPFHQGANACDPSGKCNNYSDPQAAGCPVTFTDARCGNRCTDPKTRCRDY